jgi:hypothetical protein
VTIVNGVLSGVFSRPIPASDGAWTVHNNYPAACTTGQYLTKIDDFPTCSASSNLYQTGTYAFLAVNGNGAAQGIGRTVATLITEKFDAGNAFVPGTSAYFDCPITGYYHIDCGIQLYNHEAGKWYQIEVVVNQGVNDYVQCLQNIDVEGADNYPTISVSCDAYCTDQQVIYCGTESSDSSWNLYTVNGTYMSGHLIGIS